MTAELLQVPDIARLLNCSTRTVYRLIATGQVPKPMRIGNLVRWRKEAVDAWVDQGCPTVRKSDIPR